MSQIEIKHKSDRISLCISKCKVSLERIAVMLHSRKHKSAKIYNIKKYFIIVVEWSEWIAFRKKKGRISLIYLEIKMVCIEKNIRPNLNIVLYFATYTKRKQ